MHLAAYSGGIDINRTKPADFYFINMMLQALVFEEAARYGKLKKRVYSMDRYSYLVTEVSPIDESQMSAG